MEGQPEAIAPETLNQLIDKEILTLQPREVETEEVITRFVTESNTPVFVLMPTADCNMRCAYCGQTHRRMRWTEETRSLALQKISEAMSQEGAPTVELRWYGGEPLLELLGSLTTVLMTYVHLKLNAIRALFFPFAEEAARRNGKTERAGVQITPGISKVAFCFLRSSSALQKAKPNHTTWNHQQHLALLRLNKSRHLHALDLMYRSSKYIRAPECQTTPLTTTSFMQPSLLVHVFHFKSTAML